MVGPKYWVSEGSRATLRSSSCAKNRFIKSFCFVFIRGRSSFGLGSSRFRIITSCNKFRSLSAPARFVGWTPQLPGRRHRFPRDMSDPREPTKVYSYYRGRCRTVQYRIVLICRRKGPDFSDTTKSRYCPTRARDCLTESQPTQGS